jgi:hypothetical protein
MSFCRPFNLQGGGRKSSTKISELQQGKVCRRTRPGNSSNTLLDVSVMTDGMGYKANAQWLSERYGILV